MWGCASHGNKFSEVGAGEKFPTGGLHHGAVHELGRRFLLIPSLLSREQWISPGGVSGVCYACALFVVPSSHCLRASLCWPLREFTEIALLVWAP